MQVMLGRAVGHGPQSALGAMLEPAFQHRLPSMASVIYVRTPAGGAAHGRAPWLCYWVWYRLAGGEYKSAELTGTYVVLVTNRAAWRAPRSITLYLHETF
jgi:hypothetical protein